MSDAYRGITRRLLRLYRTATPEQIAAGAEWYDLAFSQCERIGWRNRVDVTHAVGARDHLSARSRWSQNLELLDALLAGQSKPSWALGRPWELAEASLASEDPLDTFSWRARKTKAFAQAILGDPHAVVVDTWVARAVGVPEDSIRTHSGYLAVAESYKRGGRIAGIAARDLQATNWIQVRGAAV